MLVACGSVNSLQAGDLAPRELVTDVALFGEGDWYGIGTVALVLVAGNPRAGDDITCDDLLSEDLWTTRDSPVFSAEGALLRLSQVWNGAGVTGSTATAPPPTPEAPPWEGVYTAAGGTAEWTWALEGWAFADDMLTSAIPDALRLEVKEVTEAEARGELDVGWAHGRFRAEHCGEVRTWAVF